AENRDLAFRNFVQFLDEDGALRTQALDHVTVVHDLMPDIDRGAELLDGPLNNLDGSLDTGTEAARLGQNHSHHVKSALAKAGAPDFPSAVVNETAKTDLNLRGFPARAGKMATSDRNSAESRRFLDRLSSYTNSPHLPIPNHGTVAAMQQLLTNRIENRR